MTKICITTKTLGIGGAEMIVKMIAPRLKQLNYDVSVAYFSKKDDDLVKFLEKNMINVRYIGELTFFSAIKTFFSYYAYIKDNNFDVIFDHSPIPAFFSRIIPGNKKIVYLEHNVQEAYNPITRILNRVTYSLNNEVICCSKDVYLSNGKTGVVIDNAVDIDNLKANLTDRDIRTELGWPKDSRIIINVANTSFRKNQSMLIDAFEKVENENAYLLIVGLELDAFSSLERKIFLSKKRNKIKLYGPSTDVATILSQSDIFSLTSLQEGLPIALLEAMSFGVVPVCTNVGGIGTVVDSDCGYLVEVGDINRLANYFDKILMDDIHFKTLSGFSKTKIINNYALDCYVNDLVDIFGKLFN